MGVTGTLKTLSDPEKEIVEKEYKIKHFTYMPSAFGKNNNRFNEINDVYVEEEADYHNQIVKQILNKMSGRHDIKLPVLVFFESKVKLENFMKSASFERIKTFSFKLTEEDSDHDKIYRIKHATAPETVTLMTRGFGRGIDFVSKEESVSKNGGV